MTDRTPRVYLTLRCNLRCWFCSNTLAAAKKWPSRDELTADQWVKRLAELPEGDAAITGGEPTLHKGFLDIVRNTSKRLRVYSNFARDLAGFPGGLNMDWRASCHALTPEDARAWIVRVRAMHDLGYKITATTVHCPPAVLDVLRPMGIAVDPPQMRPEPISGPVRCTLPRMLIAPDGRRYHCVTKLVRRDPDGLVPDDNGNTIICNNATGCLACDSLSAERTPRG